MSRGSKIHELRVSMGEPHGQLIFLHNISHLRRRFIMNLCFIKQIKWNYQQTNTLNSVWSMVKGVKKVVWGWGFRASFGNRRAHPRNVGSMKWYFLKQKKSKFRNRVNFGETLEHYTTGHIFSKKTFDFQVWIFISQHNTDWCVVLRYRDCDC